MKNARSTVMKRKGKANASMVPVYVTHTGLARVANTKHAQTIAGTMATAKKESVSATKGTKVNCAQSVMLSMVNATLNLVNVNAIL